MWDCFYKTGSFGMAIAFILVARDSVKKMLP